jgi:hypothetical protein
MHIIKPAEILQSDIKNHSAHVHAGLAQPGRGRSSGIPHGAEQCRLARTKSHLGALVKLLLARKCAHRRAMLAAEFLG